MREFLTLLRERAPVAEAADHPFGQPHNAERDARPAEGPFPVALFSHGNSGLRRQSCFLTTHIASWGAVVAAPDHSGNTTFEMVSVTDPDELKQIHLNARRDRPRDLATVLDTVAVGGDRWPAVEPDEDGWLNLDLNVSGPGPEASIHPARAKPFLLPGGFHLLVGRDIQDRWQLERLLNAALIWATALTIALGLIGGLVMRRKLLRRIDSINRASRAIMAGDLARRVPTTGSGDDHARSRSSPL